VKSINLNNSSVSLKLLDDSILNLPIFVEKKDIQYIKNCNIIQKNIVKVSEHEAPEAFNVKWLSEYVYTGKEGDLCRIGVVNNDLTIANLNGSRPPKYILSYDKVLGYISSSKGKKRESF
jgi:hypothetical protein